MHASLKRNTSNPCQALLLAGDLNSKQRNDMSDIGKRISQFAEKMKSEGRVLSVMDGGLVAVSPTTGMAAFDMVEMTKLNAKGYLAAYVLANNEK
ncbi:hypothetical protein [Enterobacter oligotrophicus]|uniref:hypothetical protein n=1 Tax=Enterobacter oligotrophicus TaxID=2478464 RepID=UPI0028ABAFBE|nr:hypothetical protein [Enterobacter oligotrophicus]